MTTANINSLGIMARFSLFIPGNPRHSELAVFRIQVTQNNSQSHSLPVSFKFIWRLFFPRYCCERLGHPAPMRQISWKIVRHLAWKFTILEIKLRESLAAVLRFPISSFMPCRVFEHEHSAACRFVLARLYCPVPNQENSFRITVGEFSDELLNDISRTTYDYTIPLGLNNVLVGSGTLINIDATPGILTAAHVIKVSGWNNSIGVKQALVTTPDRHASYLWERMENLDWWISKPVDPEWGPDLAFIRLPTSGRFIEQIKGKKSFWPLTKNPSQRVEDANSSDVFAAVCGFVAEETRDGEPESGFQQVERLQGYSFIEEPGPEQARSEASLLFSGWETVWQSVQRLHATGSYTFKQLSEMLHVPCNAIHTRHPGAGAAAGGGWG